MSADESLFTEPQPDRFEHESPIRMFTEWNVHGCFAIGKGLRPSPAHLPVYLDAMEKKEGWRLGQMFLDEHGVPRTMWFRRVPTIEFLPEPPRIDFSSIETFLQTLGQALGISYEQLTADFDKGSWGDGTTPCHVEHELPADYFDNPEPIPTGVYWCDEGGNFYDTGSSRGMGLDFYQKWASRKSEFPQSLEEAASIHLVGSETYDALREMPEVQAVLADDPVNPRHYGGTACAEIGELLTPNCYQVLKYVWRLGEKDDPCIELGKAIWYAERELMLGLPRSRKAPALPGMKKNFVVERAASRSPFTQTIAMMLWDMCYGFGTELHWRKTTESLIQVLMAEKAARDCTDRGRGQQP